MKSNISALGNLLLLVVALVLGTLPCRAAAPVGNYDLDLGDKVLYWDFSGEYDETIDVDGIPLRTQYSLNVDSKGKISGSGTVTASGYIKGNYIRLNGDIITAGTITTSGRVIRGALTQKMSGSASVDGYYGTFKGSMSIMCELNQDSNMLVGFHSGSMTGKVNGKSETVKWPKTAFLMQLPEDAKLKIDIDLIQLATDAKGKITGTFGDLYDGEVYGTVTGTYAATTGVSKLTLKGNKDNSGVSFVGTGTLAAGEVDVHDFSGTAFGQTLKLSPPKISKQPANVKVKPGVTTARFTVKATGSGTLSYQWYKEGVAITGKTTSVLDLTESSVAAGNYSVLVSSSSGGKVMSNVAKLTP